MSDLTSLALATKALIKRVEELEMFVYRLEARVLILERKVNDFINSMQDDGK